MYWLQYYGNSFTWGKQLKHTLPNHTPCTCVFDTSRTNKWCVHCKNVSRQFQHFYTLRPTRVQKFLHPEELHSISAHVKANDARAIRGITQCMEKYKSKGTRSWTSSIFNSYNHSVKGFPKQQWKPCDVDTRKTKNTMLGCNKIAH